jgi:PrtD family type I secretion system ABC transporter
MLVPTIYMLQIFDRVMVSQNLVTLAVISAIVFFMYIFLGVFQWLRSRILIAISIQFDQRLSQRVFQAVISAQLVGAPSVPQQVIADLTTLRQWITGEGAYSFLDAPWSLIFLIVMFLLHPILGMAAVFFMIVLAAYAWLTTKMTEESADLADKESNELNQLVYSRLRNAEVIEAHGMLTSFRRLWAQRHREFKVASASAEDLQSRMTVGGRELRTLINSLSLGIGAYLAIKGEITFGAMIAAALLMSRATSPIEAIATGWKVFLVSRKSLYRLVDVLMREAKTSPVRVSSGTLDGSIFLERVSVCVDSRTILKNISCEFSPGKTYLLLGGSGAGKTTLVKSLLGIMPNVDGKISFGGVPNGFFVHEVHGQQIGFIPQAVDLFEATIAENITRMGEINSEEVIRAAQRIDLHQFILGLPDGYDTLLGSRGVVLSGGQRQQVALARALYGNPKIVFMDEPDASLDVRGIHNLESAIANMRSEGITVILITHRLTNFDIADEVMFIERGSIVFQGSVSDYREWKSNQSINRTSPALAPLPGNRLDNDAASRA